MSARFRRSALCFVLLSLPAMAGPPREDRRAARIRSTTARPEPVDVQPSEAAPIAAAAADAGRVDLAGFLGMVSALAATFVYARSRRISMVQAPSRPPTGAGPPDPR